MGRNHNISDSVPSLLVKKKKKRPDLSLASQGSLEVTKGTKHNIFPTRTPNLHQKLMALNERGWALATEMCGRAAGGHQSLLLMTLEDTQVTADVSQS